MHIGEMDITSVKCLINSISRFIHLVSCQTIKPVPLQKHCNSMVGVLKSLKPVLDDVVDYKIPLDEHLCRECEELDMQVNEAREFIETWSPKMSKFHSILQSGELLIKLQSTSLQICHIIVRNPKSASSVSVSTNHQHYMLEIQCIKKEQAMVYIEEALGNLRDNIEPCYEHLKEITELLQLKSNQELLKESIAVEKERLDAEVNKTKGDLDESNQVVNLVCNLRNKVMKIERLEVKNGVSVPSYFRCPLSMELMSDPVIVASGQTYERHSIQMWLDHGLTACPKTRQRLMHTNLIPNYTVKTMIMNWCEENKVELPSNSKHSTLLAHISSPSDYLLHQDLDRVCSFGSSHSSNSNSKSSLQTGNAFEKQKDDNSFGISGESNRCQSIETEKFEQLSLAPSCSNSRSNSFSSSISSTDYVLPHSKEVSAISNKHQNAVLSGEITNGRSASPARKELGISLSLSREQSQSPVSKIEKVESEIKSNSHSKVEPHPVSNLGADKLTTTSHVNKLIEDLQSQSIETQTAAAEELRLLTRHNMENRIIVGQCGAITHLLPLLYSELKITQEHAVTAILNLSINEDNKTLIMEAGAIEPLIHVLQTGNDGAKENSAAAIFSLSVVENNKAKIGRSGAVKALVDLLASGTLRGKKDAATALFNLSIFHENKIRIVHAGAVKFLVMLLDPADGMVDKAVALLANLSTIAEGRLEIAREGGIPLLVELVEFGSYRGKENAASILLQLCLHSRKFCNIVLQEGAVPPLVGLTQSGTPRAKEKAQQLLSHFRNQREGATGKRKS